MPNTVSTGAMRKMAPPPVTHLNDSIETAIVCCTQAREAARCGRMAAAQGLLQTAMTMYSRTEPLMPVPADTVSQERLESLVSELCYSAQVIEVETVARQVIAPRPTMGDA